MSRTKDKRPLEESFLFSPHKFYIKDGKINFIFWKFKLKPIDYVALFNHKDNSASLAASIASIVVSKQIKIKILLNILQVSKIHIMKRQVKV